MKRCFWFAEFPPHRHLTLSTSNYRSTVSVIVSAHVSNSATGEVQEDLRSTLKSSLSLHVKIGSQHHAPSPSQAEKPFLLIIYKTPTTLKNGFRRPPQPRHCVCQGEDTDEQSTEDSIEKGKPSSLRRQSCYANPDHQ